LAFSRAAGECAATLSVAKKGSSTSAVTFGSCNGITSVRSISLGCFLNLKGGRIGSFWWEILRRALQKAQSGRVQLRTSPVQAMHTVQLSGSSSG
jgi:hypothetical protein